MILTTTFAIIAIMSKKADTMNRYLPIILGVVFLLTPPLHSQTKFYQYYSTGIEFLEKQDWIRAIGEFQSAASLEFEDAARKRTYGTHFIDYHPHREMGYAYAKLGEDTSALRELKLSFAYDPSERAADLMHGIDPTIDPLKEIRLAEAARAQRLAEEKQAREDRKKLTALQRRGEQMKEDEQIGRAHV